MKMEIKLSQNLFIGFATEICQEVQQWKKAVLSAAQVMQDLIFLHTVWQ